jgi:hypothetical protein
MGRVDRASHGIILWQLPGQQQSNADSSASSSGCLEGMGCVGLRWQLQDANTCGGFRQHHHLQASQ